MNLLVLGGTGPTGALVIEQALASGHSVRALVRSPEKVANSNSNLEVVTGQATDAADVARALDNVDAVIVALGASKGTVITDSTKAVLAGLATHPAARLVVLSSFAVLKDRLSAPAKAMAALAMSAIVKDKATAEQLLRDSAVNYTIVYATRLTDAAATGRVVAVADNETLRLGNTISRADVASALLDEAGNAQSTRRNLVITT